MFPKVLRLFLENVFSLLFKLGKFCVLSSKFADSILYHPHSIIYQVLKFWYLYFLSLQFILLIFYRHYYFAKIFYLLMDLKRICNCDKHFNDGCWNLIKITTNKWSPGYWYVIFNYCLLQYFGYCVEKFRVISFLLQLLVGLLVGV